MKKGFTLVEMLIVMVLLAALLAFSIDSMKKTPNVTYKNSMKSDIINASLNEQNIYDNFYEYESVDLFSVSGTGSLGGKYSLSPFNSMEIETINCSSGTGFFITVVNEKIKNFSMTLNSCNQSKIQEVTL
ncbi:MAG: prepilin-type N-terminal cleavage/methylation domain-containing protein [Sulfuricurvum sp.]|jgi:prepilin-type N-terminal cleavage/methylation domain-containing protein|uniref:prepilin-type N-terminal cleavage/methylation domain-containing protein n=1 Tax=Sulfuricurvum sp. TaxID=2025608 RepID=UPI0025D08757|nr:prepilin-type N-terminal cleavage/methylation domain-containing protein [Sulfuricurvum sp.]MCK9372445.1 prepilin-type N-terminal cleavage/methylation domain-containing protein [Sulfuricurvum sp.]